MRQEERDVETRLRLAARLSALRRRAFRSCAADARRFAAFLTLLVAAAATLAAILLARRVDPGVSLLAVCVFYPLCFSCALLRLRRRAPRLPDLVRRLDARFPADSGVLLAAVDPVCAGGDDMMRETTRRAERLLDAADALSDDELAVLLFGCDPAGNSYPDRDPRELRHARLAAIPARLLLCLERRERLRALTTAAAALALLVFVAAGLGVTPRSPHDKSTAASTATDALDAPVAPPRSAAAPPPGAAASADDSRVPGDSVPDSLQADDPRSAFAAFNAELRRARSVAASLVDALRPDGGDSDSDAYASSLALFRELDDVVGSSAGLTVRAAGAADAAAALIRTASNSASGSCDTSGNLLRALLTARRAGALIRDLNELRRDAPDSCQGTLTSGMTRWARGTTTEERAAGRDDALVAAETFLARLEQETRAAVILAASWEFARADHDAAVCDDALRRACLDALERRAGLTPTDGSARLAVPAFFEELAAARVGVEELSARYDELACFLAAPDAEEFLAFAERVAAEEPGLAPLLFNEPPCDPVDFVRRRLALLGAAEREADAERWGRAATLLHAPLDALELFDSTRPAEDATETKTNNSIRNANLSPRAAALAFRLSFGALTEHDDAGGYDVAAAAVAAALGNDSRVEPADDVPGSRAFADERKKSALDPDALRALEREASLGETAALDGRADLAPLREETARRADSGGVISDAGAEPDAAFAGGGSARVDDFAAPFRSDAGFNAELPDDVRERLDRAQRWTPDEERLRRAREFRRRLWNAAERYRK